VEVDSDVMFASEVTAENMGVAVENSIDSKVR